MSVRDIGLKASPPRASCDDRHCPYHGTISVRRRTVEGVVKSARMQKTVTVERDYLHFVRKYNRYEKRRSRILVHNPPCVGAKEGDMVMAAECRPIAKRVSFVVVEKRGLR